MAELVQALGRPWDEIETTYTLPRLAALRRYWRNHPPAHVLLAAWLKYKPPPGGERRREQKGDLGELIQMFAASGGVIHG